MNATIKLLQARPAREIARELAVQPARVQKWRERGRVPATHWLALVRYAQRQGVKLTLDQLASEAAGETV